MGKSSEVDVTTYYGGFHFIISHGVVDSIKEIIVNKKVLWSGTALDTSNVIIDKPEIFGGLGREGGITGKVSFWFGAATQGLIPYLSPHQANQTAFRGVVSIILEDIWLGTNYYLKPWWFRVSRIHKLTSGATQWADSIAEPLPKCINPIHVIREILTNTTWGLAISESRIGASFLSAATICFNEGRGFAWYWNNPGDVDTFLDEVKTHAGCELYQDRVTGLFEITLLRKITDINSLPVLNETIIRKVDNFHTAALGSLVSNMTIHYTNRANWDKSSVTRINTALIARQGYEVSKTLKFMGCTDDGLANTIAEEQLARSSYPLKSCVINATSAAAGLNPGSAFRLDWPDYTSESGELIMRVLTINLGTLANSQVTINAIQDIFSVNTSSTSSIISSGWVNPVSTPSPIVKYIQLEVPYYFFVRRKGDAEGQKVATDTNYLLTAAISPNPSSIHANILSTTTGNFAAHGACNYCCYFELASPVDRFATVFTISGVIDVELLHAGKCLLVGGEFVFLQSFTGNSLTVARGVLDTLPKDHSAGTSGYALQSFNGSDQIGYFIGETVSTKLLDVTPQGTLAEASAPTYNYTIAGRFHLPYPPANVKVNGSYWPISVPNGTISVTYATRNRLQQTTGAATSWYSGNILNEAGVSYEGILTNIGTSTTVSVSGASPLTFSAVVAGSYSLVVRSSSANGFCLNPFVYAFTVT